ncbi:MAG: hypothetical protein ACQESR_30675 [Planctomycetota bacterium]
MMTVTEEMEQGLVRFDGWRVAEDHAEGTLTFINPDSEVQVRAWLANGGTAAQADQIRRLESEMAELRKLLADLG